MYGRGLSIRQISDTIEELYGFEVCDSFVSDVTDKILPQIHQWQSRPLDEIYPVVLPPPTIASYQSFPEYESISA